MLSTVFNNQALNDDQLDLVFRALGDRTRRKMLARLTEGSAMVGELAKPFDMSLPAAAKHLRVLERAGLVDREIDGRIHRCSLSPLPLHDAEQWLDQYRQFWEETLDSLSDHFQNNSSNE